MRGDRLLLHDESTDQAQRHRCESGEGGACLMSSEGDRQNGESSLMNSVIAVRERCNGVLHWDQGEQTGRSQPASSSCMSIMGYV